MSWRITLSLAAWCCLAAHHTATATQAAVDEPSPAVAASKADNSKAEAPSAIAVPVFSEQWSHITRPRNIQRGHMVAVDRYEPIVRVGTAFAYKAGTRVLIVTAAHVVPKGGPVSEFTTSDGTVYSGKDNYTIEVGPCKVRVGGCALTPKRWVVDPELDVALIELDPTDLQCFGMEVLAAGPVKRDDEVRLWGFPAIRQKDKEGNPLKDADGKPLPVVPSASQTSQRSDVTDVRPGEVVCAPLNGIETRGGFSGGPVLHKGKVVGMIMRSTAENTRCRAMPSIDKLAEAFKAADDVKSGKAKPAVNAPQVIDYTDPTSPKA